MPIIDGQLETFPYILQITTIKFNITMLKYFLSQLQLFFNTWLNSLYQNALVAEGNFLFFFLFRLNLFN